MAEERLAARPTDGSLYKLMAKSMVNTTIIDSPNPDAFLRFSGQDVKVLQERVAAGEKKTNLAKEFGISRETLYQYLRRIKQEMKVEAEDYKQ